MAKNSLDKIRRLKQVDSTWLCSAKPMRAWIDGDPPYRPFMILVLDQDQDRIRGNQLFEQRPTADDVLGTLLKSMNRPVLGGGRRARPARILLDDAELAASLAPRLATLDIRCQHQVSLAMIENARREFEAFRRSSDPQVGLMDVPGITHPLAAELYAAAADFYKQAPWLQLSDAWPIGIRYPADARPRYAVVMGHGKETYGLSVYESIGDLEALYSGLSPEEFARRTPWISLLFESPMFLSFDDLDAIELHGWPVAGQNAYPLPVRVTPPDTVGVPSLADIAWLAAALRVVPDFVAQHLRPKHNVPEDAEATYSLPDIHGNQRITLRFPVMPGQIWDDDDFEDEDELEDFIDDWYWDEESHRFARAMGSFLFDFIDDLIDNSNLTPRTIQKHIDNCWLIGKLTAEHGGYRQFSPTIFLGPADYEIEFRRKVTESPYAWTSYRATWRKLEKHVRSLGQEP